MPVIALLPRTPSGRFASLYRFWTVAVALVVGGFCLASILMLNDLRQNTWDQAVTGAQNLVNALAQDIDRNVELYDLSLRAVADGLSEPDLAHLSPRVQDLMLFDRAATGRDLGSVLVLDRDGKVVRGSAPGFIGGDLSDRDYFQAHKADPGLGLLISGPFRRRVTGDDMVIALSRGLRSADGGFAGVVVGTIRLTYFQALFSRKDLGAGGKINLFLTDGTFVAGLPFAPAEVGRSFAGSPNFKRFLAAPSGTFSGLSSTDKLRRIYSFTRVGDLPLIVVVGPSEDDVFAVWRTKTATIGVTLLALCTVAAGLALKLVRQFERTARTERRLSQSEAEYRLLADNVQDVIVRLDPSLRRSYISPACRSVLGFDPEELIGLSPEETAHPDDWPNVAALILSAREEASDVEVVYRLRHRDGRVIWVEGRYGRLPDGRGFIGVLRDVTRRKLAEERTAVLNAELAHLARNDALTSLANRRHFDETLDVECRRAACDGAPVSLLLLDVDRFKLFNDRYGHPAGDACLRTVAEAVRDVASRPRDLAARYGGEEIAIVLPGTDEAGAAVVAEGVRRAVEALALPHAGNPRCGSVVTVSVGCATARPRGGSADVAAALVAAADVLLYEAKRTGRNRVATDLPVAPEAPRPVHDDHRLALLEAYRAAGALEPSVELDNIARVAARLLDMPMAFVSIVGRDAVTVVGRHGTDVDAVPLGDAYCAHTISGDDPLIIPDTAGDPRVADYPLTLDGVAFYAGAPIVSSVEGRKLGALCVVDTAVRPPLDQRGRDLLAELARLVMDELDHRRGGGSPAGRGGPLAA